MKRTSEEETRMNILKVIGLCLLAVTLVAAPVAVRGAETRVVTLKVRGMV